MIMKFDLKKFLLIVTPIASAILPLVPGGSAISMLIPVVTHAIGVAEQRGGTGPEKKARAMAIIQDAVQVMNTVASDEVKLDPTEVQEVASYGIDAIIGTMHVIRGAKVEKAA